jgi:flagellar operon protein
MVQNLEKIKNQSNEQKQAAEIKGESFENILQGKLQSEKLIFSKHAEQRLNQRDIHLSDTEMQKLGSAVSKAQEKGVRNTLVLMDRTAFIVNVPSNTVITAIGGKDLEENVFTQIDGAVIV